MKYCWWDDKPDFTHSLTHPCTHPPQKPNFLYPDFTGWVPDVLRLLAVSRSGLTANELLEILERIGYQENVKVTQFDWLILRQCLAGNLTENSNGLFNFSHQQLREVVEYVLLRKLTLVFVLVF